jgi:lipopolysaccharide biosynthesis glycosyltransferase
LKIVSIQFDYNGLRKYEKLAEVFEYSVKKNCPEADLELLKVKPPELKKKIRSKSFASNTLKLKLWLKVLKNTDDDVVFMDCDMIVLKDISDVFKNRFDIGYTKRTGSRIPYNGGVMFVKNTPEAIKFVELWKEINDKMYNDYSFHHTWRNKYAGMNQAAFGYIMETGGYKAKLKSFSCDIWNSCVENWPKINDETRIVHIKGALRRSVLMNSSINSVRYRRAVIIWRNMAIDAGIINLPKLDYKTATPIPIRHVIRKARGLNRSRRRY